ncbi:MAG: zinc ABC transporter ATP-binding protein ZnuC [Rhodospirillales bacterium]|nr:zinc ABC transporter ATP-binding protein ZnuC [Rhodospirillales bacterium]
MALKARAHQRVSNRLRHKVADRLDEGHDEDAATATGILISARDISLRLGRVQILENVAIRVRDGEILSLIGPNGAGKTSLVRVLLGLLPPTSGEIERRPRLRVGYVPQRLAIDPVLPLSVKRLMTLTARRPLAAVRAALAETGVAALLEAPVQALSGGEFQRVLLARALLREPQLLVLDEPVQGVDFAGEAALYELIGAIRERRRCGVLMVSHDLHTVMAATDRVICLNRHVCCAGGPASVGRDPEFVRLFGPRAAAALGVYAHHHNHAHDLAGAVVEPTDDAGERGAGADVAPRPEGDGGS